MTSSDNRLNGELLLPMLLSEHQSRNGMENVL